jgi:hypothetical protein|nr:MAG TPA: hypothetical protein [Caudoviricetes sp.]
MKAFTNYRYYVLFALNFMSAILFIAMPDDSWSTLRFIAFLVLTKAAACLLVYVTMVLISYWSDRHEIEEIESLLNGDF